MNKTELMVCYGVGGSATVAFLQISSPLLLSSTSVLLSDVVMKRSASPAVREQQQEKQQVPQSHESRCLQTPHTLRLLQLIREGSHTELALERLDQTVLQEDKNSSGSSAVLWDLMGRLREILTAPEWQTRQAAATALEHVARTVLKGEDGPSAWIQEQQQDQSLQLLTLETMNVDKILEKGRKLYSMAEDAFMDDHDDSHVDNKEEDADQATSATERLRLQRHIMARRLGLGSIINVAKDLLPDTITDADMILPTKKRKTTPSGVDNDSTVHAADAAVLPDSFTPFRNLLVGESSGTTSTNNSPTLLFATELLVGILDPLWYHRHGAILGFLALVRAWKTQAWGPWLHDALVRVLSVGTLLDRFGDPSSSSMIAPIREMAGQLAAIILLQAADAATRVRALEILKYILLLSKESEWEMRQGVMAVYKFVLATEFAGGRSGCLSDAQCQNIGKQAMDRLREDNSDDVKGAAAQVLLQLVLASSADDNDAFGVWSSCPFLWSALSVVNRCCCVSYVNDLMALFVALLKQNATKFLSLAQCKAPSVVLLLDQYLRSPLESTRVAAMTAVGILAGVEDFWKDTSLLGSEEPEMLVLHVFETYYSTSSSWDRERETTWGNLCLIQWSNQQESSILVALLERYLFAQHLEGTFAIIDNLPVEPARAIGKFMKYRQHHRQSVLEVSIVSSLCSPLPSQCEAACVLLDTIDPMPNYPLVVEHLNNTPSFLTQSGQWLEFEQSRLSETFVTVFTHSFRKSLEEVMQTPDSQQAVVEKLIQLWKAATVAHPKGQGSTVLQMRMNVLITGAKLVSGRVPSKATPIVQPLMTSLKNESSEQRLSMTSTLLVRFLSRCLENGLHEKATDKVIATLCRAVTSPSDRFPERAAADVLQKMIVALRPDSVLKQSAISSHLFVFALADCNDVKQVVEAMRLLLALSKGLQANSDIASSLVAMAPSLIRRSMALDGHHDIVSSTLENLHGAQPRELLALVVPVLLGYLSKRETKMSACKLFTSLVELAGVSLCPYIRDVLPATLALVTDKDCSKVAYELFASLVRIAPLVSRSKNQQLATGKKSVIDHLIFGEPLPKYVLPCSVTTALREGKIELRGYQEEGIAWLRFLHSVKLSGALCDGKWLI